MSMVFHPETDGQTGQTDQVLKHFSHPLSTKTKTIGHTSCQWRNRRVPIRPTVLRESRRASPTSTGCLKRLVHEWLDTPTPTARKCRNMALEIGALRIMPCAYVTDLLLIGMPKRGGCVSNLVFNIPLHAAGRAMAAAEPLPKQRRWLFYITFSLAPDRPSRPYSGPQPPVRKNKRKSHPKKGNKASQDPSCHPTFRTTGPELIPLPPPWPPPVPIRASLPPPSSPILSPGLKVCRLGVVPLRSAPLVMVAVRSHGRTMQPPFCTRSMGVCVTLTLNGLSAISFYPLGIGTGQSMLLTLPV